MRRYLSIVRSTNGKTTVTVTLVDGTESAKYSTFTYSGIDAKVKEAVKLADKMARLNLESGKRALEELEAEETKEAAA